MLGLIKFDRRREHVIMGSCLLTRVAQDAQVAQVSEGYSCLRREKEAEEMFVLNKCDQKIVIIYSL